uniref:hypothetical protein n=1 Tax=unclassified Streptomyces TaxID=2593676 RepID=UPI003F49169B
MTTTEGPATVRQIDGRSYETRAELAQRHGISQRTLSRYWDAQERNGHPDAVQIDGVMHWPSAAFDEWLSTHRPQRQKKPAPPADMGGPADFARICGHSTPHTIMDWVRSSPPGFPEPDYWHALPSGRRRPYWREERMRQWAEDGRSRHGRAGANPGRPRTAAPYAGDPRLTLARQLLAENPDATTAQLVDLMIQQYPERYSRPTWTRIAATARQNPEE